MSKMNDEMEKRAKEHSDKFDRENKDLLLTVMDVLTYCAKRDASFARAECIRILQNIERKSYSHKALTRDEVDRLPTLIRNDIRDCIVELLKEGE